MSKKASPITTTFMLHLLILSSVIAAIMADSMVVRAQIIFLTVMGSGVGVYFNTWSLAQHLTTPFESIRIFPKIGLAIEFGGVIGAALAVSVISGVPKLYYLWFWGAIEIATVVQFGLVLIKRQTASLRIPSTATRDQQKQSSTNILEKLKQYHSIPVITVWVFLFALVYFSILTLVGTSFEKSGYNLTVLYGCLDLIGALFSFFCLSFVYPKVKRWAGLATCLLLVSSVLFCVGISYFVGDFFTTAVLAYLIFKVANNSFIIITVSNKLTLYPQRDRDQLRLVADIWSFAAGFMFVGVLFLLPKSLLYPSLTTLLGLLVIVSAALKKRYNAEVSKFLDADEAELKENAVVVFDQFSKEAELKKLIYILLESKDLHLRLRVLQTFAHTPNAKPLPAIIDLLLRDEEHDLQAGCILCLERLPPHLFGPFLEHEMREALMGLNTTSPSARLRSIALRVLVKHCPGETTIRFIMKALEDTDYRVVADAVEELAILDYPGVPELALPFLANPAPRVRGNAIITLRHHHAFLDETREALLALLDSDKVEEIASGIYAVGETNDSTQLDRVRELLISNDLSIKRCAAITLVKLGEMEICESVVDIITGDDEQDAINTAYLTLRLESTVLFEEILARIYNQGPEAREKAAKRYERCAPFQNEIVNLLTGKSGSDFLVRHE
ncbi:MAG: hypothetical protein VYA34_01290 [Myxococcota bacterium]|nr:hypothetical protein [Myxococcota bacterium]